MQRRLAMAGLGIAAISMIGGCTSSTAGEGANSPIPPASGTPVPTTSGNPVERTTEAQPAPVATQTANPFPTETADPDAALKASLADVGTKWVHAYANADVPTFCELSDLDSLLPILHVDQINSCDSIIIKPQDSPDEQAALKKYLIADSTKIVVDGDHASTDRANIRPAGLPGIDWIHEPDGTWRVDVDGFFNRPH